jgi:hypothetical protein
MTFVRYPYIWLPLVIVFGVLPTILFPFVALFFAFVWAVVLLVAAVTVVAAAVSEFLRGLRAIGRALGWHRLGPAQAGASRFDAFPSVIRRRLFRSPARSAPPEPRKPETRW